MQTTEQMKHGVADLYWLAYLLTGDRRVSLDIALGSLNGEDDANPFFTTWVQAWSRRLVIAKALASIREELGESARRVASARPAKATAVSRSSVQGDATKAQLEAALLAIDVLPRCVLLLTVFEGVTLEDAAVLLNSEPKLIKKAQLIGVWGLNRNLRPSEIGTSAVGHPFGLKLEMRHAG